MTTQREHSLSPSDLSPVASTSPEMISAESHEQEIVALQQELEALRVAHLQELASLRFEMAAQVSSLRASLTPAESRIQATAAPMVPVTTPAEIAEVATEASTSFAEHADSAEYEAPTSRRTLLKWGGLAAAAGLAAAGGATLTSQTAQAADGGSLTLGSASNLAEHVTTLTYDGAETAPTVFEVATTADDSVALLASAGNGTTNGAYGVYGTAGNGLTSYGVYGAGGTNANGVYGFASNTGGAGVVGASDSGYGVVGTSSTGVDLTAFSSGRIWQATAGFIGAPTTGSYNAGEQIRDQLGDLYICVVTGSPGTWKKVASLDTSYKGGAIGFLSTPIRVYDSRVANAPLVGSMTRNVQVTGVVINGVQVPKGATGCIGNLTVVRPTASGYLVIYPQGSATPSTSTVNFVANQTVPNAFAVGLSAGGQVTVHSFTSGQCHFIVDINGFVS